jgi:hypothetical protein
MQDMKSRQVPCFVCGRGVRVDTCLAQNLSAPEMVQAPEGGVWLGFVRGRETTEMVACCSAECLAIMCEASA